MSRLVSYKANALFAFTCRLCGDCCTGSHSILLNLYDLWKLARFHRMGGTRELFDRKLLVLKVCEHNTLRPALRFKRRPFPACPFLVNTLDNQDQFIGVCALHPQHKPLVCGLAPLGRIVDAEAGETEYVLVEPRAGCPGMGEGRPQSTAEALEEYTRELAWEDRYYRLLDKFREQIQEDFYFFSAEDSFETILSDREKQGNRQGCPGFKRP